MSKFVRVMYDLKSDASGFTFKLNEINEAENWYKENGEINPTGGFYFSTEEGIIRWLLRGNVIYDVIIPEDAIVIQDQEKPNIIYRANKIIIGNPKKINDEYAIELYKKSNLPESIYLKVIGILAMCGYEKASLKVIEDKVTKDNINIVLETYISTKIYLNEKSDKEIYNKILKFLKEKYKK